MIEEKAIVSSVDAGLIRVRAFGPASCARCAAGQGCGGGLLARLLKRRDAEVEVAGMLEGVSVGDVVVVGLAEAALLRASVWVYLVPVVAMFSLAAFAQAMLGAGDLGVAAFGLAGLAGGFWITGNYARGAQDAEFRPRLLRRPSRSETEVCAGVKRS